MIIVIYRWRVAPENQAAFVAAWSSATVSVLDSTDGARGSMCVSREDEPTEFLTIARWSERSKWEAFLPSAATGPLSKLHDLAELVSHDVYSQHGDFLAAQE